MERRGRAGSMFVRLVSPEILLWGQIRVSFFLVVPGCACRGRHHARVSTTMEHFRLEKEGGGV